MEHTQRYIKRLEKFEELLLLDAKNPKGVKFDMNYWVKPAAKGPGVVQENFPWDEDKNLIYTKDAQPTASCNTFTCALGLAAVSGVFKEEGLTYMLEELQDGEVMIFPQYKKVIEFEAGAEFFGLNEDEASWLFDPTYYDNQKGQKAEQEVAKRVNYLIKHGKLPKRVNNEYNLWSNGQE